MPLIEQNEIVQALPSDGPDEAFAEWFIDISNLDQEELGQSLAELEAVVARDTLGIDATEERIASAYRTVKILNWAVGIASVWAWIYPNPYPFAMLAAGGTKHHSELLAPFGLNARDPAFWQRGLAVIERMIEELEALQ